MPKIRKACLWLVIIALIAACDDFLDKEEHLQFVNPVTERITTSQEPNLQKLLAEAAQLSPTRLKGLNTESALKKAYPHLGLVYYTFNYKEKPPFSIKNFSITVKEGKPSYSILLFEPEFEWLMEQDKKDGWSSFTGKHTISDIHEKSETIVTMDEGKVTSTKHIKPQAEGMVCTTTTYLVTVGNDTYGYDSHLEYLTTCKSTGVPPGGGSGGGLPGGDTDPLDPTLPLDPGDGVPIIRPELLALIEEALKNHPDWLLDIPCEQIVKWKALATRPFPNRVKDKIRALKDHDAEWYYPLYIQDAGGATVNMDFFSVNVGQLPNGMSAEDFLSYIRLNINDFIDKGADTSFSPYDHNRYPFDEIGLWLSENPLGALMHIDIFSLGFMPNDGSVMVTNFGPDHWVFSTYNTAKDWDHPVSGNREFGFTQNNDGTYTFYTMGVDRITTTTGDFLGRFFLGDPYEVADPVWESFQQKVSWYANMNGGSASVVEPTKHRPDWQKLADFITGKITVKEFGCKD